MSENKAPQTAREAIKAGDHHGLRARNRVRKLTDREALKQEITTLTDQQAEYVLAQLQRLLQERE